MELVDQWMWVGYCFFASTCICRHCTTRLSRKEAVQAMMERANCFGVYKNLCSCCFLLAIKFFSHFIGECQCKYAVGFEGRS